MPILLHRVLTFAAVPFLALFGFAFLCVRAILAAGMRLAGLELAWPPVMVNEEDQPPVLPSLNSGASRPSLPQNAMTRVDAPRF
ncbi:hypothetical protein [Occallatibacter savannae]|uniref:hypothetical protein n=1 Tax=Occallatibacter savannae TaxID=1002691 RepID=UPI0013A54877|nr:hypothetical protein [Occallatibacter savannae]